jgi:chromosome segregation ATPase
MVAERDAILARATELEELCAAQQQAMGALERRLESAERQLLDRDDRTAALQGELDSIRREGEELSAGPSEEEIAELLARADHAESALALHVADLAHVAEAHASETAALEAQLRERARVIAEMEKELGRREQLVRELVTTLEEAREGGAGPRFEEVRVDGEEIARLRRKIDELAMEVARRDGELVAREWRLAELEARAKPSPPAGSSSELDALRQALAQEHAARVAAESGEELTRARAELARQSALLDQMRNASKAS